MFVKQGRVVIKKDFFGRGVVLNRVQGGKKSPALY